jgi:DNA transposition AAA+ family ATPase
MENATTEKSRTVYPCDKALRQKLLELREQPGWSNNAIAKKMGVNSSLVSQYLNDAGCVYDGDVPKLERSINDLLENEARRRASGVETTQSAITEQIRDAFEYIRKTTDIGVILAESGDGKTRGIEHYIHGEKKTGAGGHPTAIHYRTFVWSNDLKSVEMTMFELAGKKDWDKFSKRTLNTIKNLRGSERLIIVDDAHKLTRPALQWWFDFHDATLCPIAFVGTFELLDKLEDDPQRFSRVGLHFEITNDNGRDIDRALIKHLVSSIAPHANGELAELVDLCEQVAKEHGHYRSVHKQLKVAVEIKSGKPKLSYVEAFRSAHTMLVRNYNLN